jgi:galactose oxidase-like protein
VQKWTCAGRLAATAALTALTACAATGTPAAQPAGGPAVPTPLVMAPPVASASAARLTSGNWSALPRAPISPRSEASVVWTGRELLVWGGQSGPHGDVLHGDGAAYDPSTGRWRRLPAAPLPARVAQAAAWTGTQMIIWGGYDQVSASRFRVTGTGAAYNPATNQWKLLPRSPLSPRADAIAVWTGSTLVLLGGQPAVRTGSVHGYRDGAAFSPVLDRWQHIAPPGAPKGHPLTWRAAVMADGQLLAWSQWAASRRTGPGSFSESGGVDLYSYTGSTGRWRLVPPRPGMLPDAEEVRPAGRLVIVRGSTFNCGNCAGPFVPEATDLYDPVANTWTRLPPDPLAGTDLGTAWTGTALISFDPGGEFGPVRPGDTSAYDVAGDTVAGRWHRLPSAPFGCDTDQSPAWTGWQLLMYCPRSPAGPGAGPDGLAFTVSPPG